MKWCCKLSYEDLVKDLAIPNHDIEEVCPNCKEKYPTLEEDSNELCLFMPLIKLDQLASKKNKKKK